jgi:hypothetical protein
MTCRVCKFFVFNQNDMMGACKLNPVVVNKLPQDWCGQEMPAEYEAVVIPDHQIEVLPDTAPIVEVVYDINTDEVKPKRGRRKNVDKGTDK